METLSVFDQDMQSNIENIRSTLGFLCRRVQLIEESAPVFLSSWGNSFIKRELTCLLDTAEQVGYVYEKGKIQANNGFPGSIAAGKATASQYYFSVTTASCALQRVKGICLVIQQLRHLFNRHITLEEYHDFRRKETFDFISRADFEFSKTVIRAAELAGYQGGGLTSAEGKAIRA